MAIYLSRLDCGQIVCGCAPCNLPTVLNITIAGIIACNNCFGSEPFKQKGTGLSGINGAFTDLTRDCDITGYVWRKNLGTVTVVTYSDGACAVPTGTDTLLCTAFFQCEGTGGGNAYAVDMRGKPGSYPIDLTDGTFLWSATGSAVLGEVWPSSLACSDEISYIGDGSVMVELPA